MDKGTGYRCKVLHTSLIPIVRGRPAVIRRHETIVYLGIHDAGFLRERSRLKRAMFDAVDRDKARQDYHAFMRREEAWYRMMGVSPPHQPWRVLQPVRQLISRDVRKWGGTMRKISAALMLAVGLSLAVAASQARSWHGRVAASPFKGVLPRACQ